MSGHCVDVDPDIFDAPDPWPALVICFRCPQLYPCRNWAYRTEVAGVVGGTTPEQREQWRQAWDVTALPATIDLQPVAETTRPPARPRTPPPPRAPRQLTPHGTPGAYDRHRRAGEEPCADCKADHAWRERRRVKRRQAVAS